MLVYLGQVGVHLFLETLQFGVVLRFQWRNAFNHEFLTDGLIFRHLLDYLIGEDSRVFWHRPRCFGQCLILLSPSLHLLLFLEYCAFEHVSVDEVSVRIFRFFLEVVLFFNDLLFQV